MRISARQRLPHADPRHHGSDLTDEQEDLRRAALLDRAGRAGRRVRARRRRRPPEQEIEVSAPGRARCRGARHRHSRHPHAGTMSAARRRSSRSSRARTSPAPARATSPARCSASPGFRGRQRLRLRPRPRRPLFAGPAQRLAAAEPRAAAPRRAARHLPDQRDRQLARPEELFGQLSRRVRRRRDQPHHARGAARDLPRHRRRVSADVETTSSSAMPIMAATSIRLGFDDGTRDFPPALRNAVAGGHLQRHHRRRAPRLRRQPHQRPDHLAPAHGRHAGQFLRRSQLRHLDRHPRRPDRLHLRDRLSERLAHARRAPADLARSRPRRHPADQLRDRHHRQSRSSSPACSASAPSSAEHRIRWTNLFIRDTLKQARLAAGFNRSVADQDPNLPPSIIEQNTYWFERQLHRHPAGRRVPLRQFQRRPARHLCDNRGANRPMSGRSPISTSATATPRRARPATSTIMSTTSPRAASSRPSRSAP